MSVNGVSLVPPQLEISTHIAKQMFNLEKTLVDKLLSSINMTGPEATSNSTNLEYLDLYKGNLIDIYV